MPHLREATGAAIGFTHHTEHEGRKMRGTSDLEAYRSRRSPSGASPCSEFFEQGPEAEVARELHIE